MLPDGSWVTGPPPHPRGPPWCPPVGVLLGGTTPVPAGTTESSELAPATIAGPPPHPRGPPRGGRDRGCRDGTTPAPAGTTNRNRGIWSEFRDHPRTRGDHRGPRSRWGRRWGPPPHPRGPRLRVEIGGLDFGTTPAPAGTTPAAERARAGQWDHPRTRGDHVVVGRAMAMAMGPPPHPRGPHGLLGAVLVGLGTTPAPAGTTREQQSVRHPQPGPPPHPRGPPLHQERDLGGGGTTPAPAGTTTGSTGVCRARGDHPRTRGDHVESAGPGEGRQGPPPHPRGPLGVAVDDGERAGTTPAPAGTTQITPGAGEALGDHPRTRGDHGERAGSSIYGSGPPPHPRGPPERRAANWRRTGTTPAPAGTTLGQTSTPSPARDHPRTRGDHVAQARRSGSWAGPPPHPRGPRTALSTWPRLCGTTPAPAGTTRCST